MILAIGEILHDVFPEYKRLGGAPFNFAAHLRAVDFPAAFASRVGEDSDGEKIRAAVVERGFDPAFLQTDPERPTGRVNVRLDAAGVPEFEIVRDAAYDRIAFDDTLADAVRSGPRLIYYGTLIQRTRNGFETLRKVLESRPPETRCFCDINLRPGCWSREVVAKSLRHCDVLKLGAEEMETLRPRFGLESAGDDHAAAALRERFDIDWICLTRGSEGSVLYTSEGRFAAEVGETATVKDTVGAGDAYAAVLAAGYLRNWPPDRIVRRATRFAATLCGVAGAVPDDDSVYDEFRTWIREDARE